MTDTKKYLWLTLLVAATLGLSACGDDDDDHNWAYYLGPNELVSGYYLNADTKYIPCTWYNGRRYDLTVTDQGKVYDVQIVGSYMYLPGEYFSTGVSQACYWSNNTIVDIPTGAHDGRSTGIYVYNDIIHVVGLYDPDDDSTADTLFYWNSSDDTLVDLGTSGIRPKIYGVDGDVYIAGHDGANGCYWKNPTAAAHAGIIALGADDIPTSLCINDSKVYLVGYYDPDAGGANLERACYWEDEDADDTYTRHDIAVTGVDDTDNDSSGAYFINFYDNTMYVAGQYLDIATGIYTFGYSNAAPATDPGTLSTYTERQRSANEISGYLYKTTFIVTGGYKDASGNTLAGLWANDQIYELLEAEVSTESYTTSMKMYW